MHPNLLQNQSPICSIYQKDLRTRVVRHIFLGALLWWPNGTLYLHVFEGIVGIDSNFL